MRSGANRFAMFVLLLAGLWIFVYWKTESPTSDATSISVDPGPVLPQPVVAKQPDAVQPPPKTDTAPADVVPPDNQAVKPTEKIIPPSYRLYTIQRDDTVQKISQRFYGTSKYWQSILKFNDRLDPTKLKPGQEIKIPENPENIQGIPNPNYKEQPPAPTPPNEPPKTAAEFTEYIVQSGDTLSEIAQALYSKSALWTIIRDANRDQLDEDGLNLRPGMVLRIPPPPQEAR